MLRSLFQCTECRSTGLPRWLAVCEGAWGAEAEDGDGLPGSSAFMVRTCKPKSEIAALLQQMEDLSLSFEAFDLMFIPRNCNRLAHECARLVSNEHQVVEWLVTPLGLRHIVDADYNRVHG